MRVSKMGSGVYGVFGSDGVYGVYGLPWDVNPFGEKGSRPGASALSRPKVENPAAVSLQVFTRSVTMRRGVGRPATCEHTGRTAVSAPPQPPRLERLWSGKRSRRGGHFVPFRRCRRYYRWRGPAVF